MIIIYRKEQTSGFFRYVHVVKSAESLNPTARRSLGAGPSLSVCLSLSIFPQFSFFSYWISYYSVLELLPFMKVS